MKMRTAFLTVFLSAGLSMSALAGGFSDYNDYINPDGTYSYYFMQGLKVTMDEEWYRNTIVIADDAGATFCHKDSYEKYAEEGIEGGGRLFTIGASVDTSFEQLPDYEFIGFDEEEAMNYYVELPTDYQGYAGDEEVRAGYDALWAGVEDVIAGIELVSGEPEDLQEDDAGAEVQVPLSGGWTTAEDPAITEEVRKVFDQAVQTMTGAEFEPVSLLATQVVAGTNYCLLCKETATVPGALPSWAFMYIYQDLSPAYIRPEPRDLS